MPDGRRIRNFLVQTITVDDSGNPALMSHSLHMRQLTACRAAEAASRTLGKQHQVKHCSDGRVVYETIQGQTR